MKLLRREKRKICDGFNLQVAPLLRGPKLSLRSQQHMDYEGLHLRKKFGWPPFLRSQTSATRQLQTRRPFCSAKGIRDIFWSLCRQSRSIGRLKIGIFIENYVKTIGKSRHDLSLHKGILFTWRFWSCRSQKVNFLDYHSVHGEVHIRCWETFF